MILYVFGIDLEYLLCLYVPLTQFRCTIFSAQFDIIRCFNIFFLFLFQLTGIIQLKNKTKRKTNTIARKEKKNPPKKIYKIVSALLHLTNVVKSSKINFHLYFLSVAFQLHQEKSWKNLKNPQKTKSFILYLKYFKKGSVNWTVQKSIKKKEYVLNLAPFFLQLLSLICFKCLAVFHVINK